MIETSFNHRDPTLILRFGSTKTVTIRKRVLIGQMVELVDTNREIVECCP